MWSLRFHVCAILLKGFESAQDSVDLKNYFGGQFNSSQLPLHLLEGPSQMADVKKNVIHDKMLRLPGLHNNYTDEWSSEYRSYIGGEFFPKKTKAHFLADCENGTFQYHILPSMFFKPPFYIVVQTVGSEYKIVVTWSTMILYECFLTECRFVSTATSSREPYILKTTKLPHWSYISFVPNAFQISVGIGHSKIDPSLVITTPLDVSKDLFSSKVYLSISEKDIDGKIPNIVSSILSPPYFSTHDPTSRFSQISDGSTTDYTGFVTQQTDVEFITSRPEQFSSLKSVSQLESISETLSEYENGNKKMDDNIDLGTSMETVALNNKFIKKEAVDISKRHRLVEDLLIVARCHRKILKSREGFSLSNILLQSIY